MADKTRGSQGFSSAGGSASISSTWKSRLGQDLVFILCTYCAENLASKQYKSYSVAVSLFNGLLFIFLIDIAVALPFYVH